MLEVIASFVLTTSTPFTQYAPPGYRRPPRIEVTIDRGPVIELIVRCPAGTAIISYSKLERVYCGAKRGCSGNREEIFRKSCG